jgi:NAD(P)-dependent dehydrogenase (short-subunit alcohol dehydrogenase family)
MVSPQTAIHSGFGAKSTVTDVLAHIRLDGQIAIVTGGYSGIGLETTRALSAAGATVIVPARNPQKAHDALAGIPGVEAAALDLLDPVSIDSFAASFLASGRPLHLLINNAGIMATPLQREGRGYEIQLASNHLGHFHLAARLWPALKQARGARVVTLSSGAHRYAAFDFDDPNFVSREYDKWIAYGQSKTANVLFSVALDTRGAAHHVRAFAVHPGRIETGLQRSISVEEMIRAGWRDEHGRIPDAQRAMYKTPQQGAATTVWCATSPALNGMGGVYCEDCDIAEAVPADHKPLNGVLPWAIDSEAADRLWHASEKMTGVSFDTNG